MKPELATAILERAAGKCECCGRPFLGTLKERTTLDHFFGRAKAEEMADTIWALRAECHQDKTDNRPSAQVWLTRYARHCLRHGYFGAAERALNRLEWDAMKESVGVT